MTVFSHTNVKPSLLFVISDGKFFVSHRLAIALAARDKGYRVAIACPKDSSAKVFSKHRLEHIPIVMRRKSITVMSEIQSLYSIIYAVRTFKPDVVHYITAKPIIYGGLISRFSQIPSVYAISGLGHVFIGNNLRVRILRALVVAGYKLAINHRRSYAIFQNPNDLKTLDKYGIIRRATVTIIPGSGVDLEKTTPSRMPEGETVLILPARMVYNKGVGEFVEMARILKAKGVKATFRLIGDPDSGNPTHIPRQQLNDWVEEGIIQWRPYTSNIASELAQAHIVVLPSHGGEGLPKTLIDAAAAGRASAASDVPGCRDAIINGQTGVLFNAKDAKNTARVLEPLIKSRSTQIKMGKAARKHAVRTFDIRDVCKKHLEIYETQLLHKKSQ